MQIIEIFSSIQGEGRFLGCPATFIRLAGCNLHCPWCDTKESWGANRGKTMGVADVIAKAKTLNQNLIVITGGEPTIQSEFYILTSALRRQGFFVCVETNGTNRLTHDDGVDWITCSPKPENDFGIACDADEIKLVITGSGDDELVDRLMRQHPDKTIWLQPNGYDMQNMWKHCYDLAMKFGGNVRIGVQLHKLMEVR